MSCYYYCRCCLKEKPNVYKIYQEIAEKLMSIANIYVEIDDGLPDIICDSCTMQVHQSYEFRQKCEYSDSVLRKWMYQYNNQQNYYHHQQHEHQQISVNNIGGYNNNINSHRNFEKEFIPVEEVIKIEDDTEEEPEELEQEEPLKQRQQKQQQQQKQRKRIKIEKLEEDEVNNKNDEIVSNTERIGVQEELNIENDECAIDQLQKRDENQKDGILVEERSERFIKNEIQSNDDGNIENEISNEDEDDDDDSIIKQATNFEAIMTIGDGNEENNSEGDTSDFDDSQDKTPKGKVEKQIIKVRKRTRYVGKERCCRMCDRTFTSCKILRMHQYTHLKNGEFTCNYCGKKYKKSQLNPFRRHLRYHVIEKRQQVQQFRQEQKQHNQQYQYQQEKKQQKQQQQQKLHDDYEASSSSSSLKDKPQIKLEKIDYDDDDGDDNPEEELQQQRQQQHQQLPKIYRCDKCDKSFSHLGTLRKHKKSHLKRTCPYCFKQYSYATTEGYREHIKRHISNGQDGIHYCTECNKQFATASYLRNHMVTHLPNRPKFQCSQCFKLYNSKHALDEHFNSHLGIKRPTIVYCQYCGKGYSRHSELRIHLRFHTGERPYACNYCEKTFQTSSSLIVHKRQHTGERPYECKICNKTFIRSDGIKNHMYIHSGERNFPCTICGKRFVQPHTRNAHQRKHLRSHKRINVKKEEV